MRITAITPMKNEGPYILEWVAYHRLIGINDIIVFTNDCQDGTDLMLERLDELGLVRHMPNPSILLDNPRHHIQLMKYLNHVPRLRRSDWFINLDADEFLNVHVGGGRVTDLMAAAPVDILTLSAYSFGCAGNTSIASGTGRVTSEFLKREPDDGARFPVKSFVRGSADIKRVANHTPHVHEEAVAELTWMNGDGLPLPGEITKVQTKALEAAHSGFNLAQINHYAVRSMDGFLIQRDRGSANPVPGRVSLEIDPAESLAYWRRFNRNEQTDRTILYWEADLATAMAELLRDTELCALHNAATNWHHRRVKLLRRRDVNVDIRRRIQRIHRRNYERTEAQDQAGLGYEAEPMRAAG